MKLTVLLPTLNEAGNIERLSRRIWEVYPGCPILVIDDGSTDGTPEKVEALRAEGLPIRISRRPPPACLTGSLSDGIHLAETEYVAWMDADLSQPPDILPELLERAERTGCAIATRFRGAGRQKADFRNTADSKLVALLSTGLNSFLGYWLKTPVSDFTSGYLVCRRSLLLHHPLDGDYGEYFMDLMVQLARSGVKIEEVPYQCGTRTWGYSKTGSSLPLIFRRGVKYLRTAARLRLRGSGS